MNPWLRYSLLALAVVVAGTLFVAYLIVTVPVRMIFGNKRRSRKASSPLNTLANLVEAFALAKMAGSGVKVQKSRRERQPVERMTLRDPKRAPSTSGPGEEIPF